MSFFGIGVSDQLKQELQEANNTISHLSQAIENLQQILKAKELKLQITTANHNTLVCRCLQQKKQIDELNRQLSFHRAQSGEMIEGKLRKSNSIAIQYRGVTDYSSPVIDKSKHTGKSMDCLQLLPEVRSRLPSLQHYDLEKFKPVNPEEIYLRMYFIEKEIKRHEPDMYFRVKEFSLQDDSEISYYDISGFAEDLAHQIFRKKKVHQSLLFRGESELQYEIEEFCFEIMYHKLFGSTNAGEDDRNIRMQERLFIMQNLVTPSMVGIKEKHYAYNVYQLAFAGKITFYIEFKKINSVKSPANKCRVLFEFINCLSGKLI